MTNTNINRKDNQNLNKDQDKTYQSGQSGQTGTNYQSGQSGQTGQGKDFSGQTSQKEFGSKNVGGNVPTQGKSNVGGQQLEMGSSRQDREGRGGQRPGQSERPTPKAGGLEEE